MKSKKFSLACDAARGDVLRARPKCQDRAGVLANGCEGFRLTSGARCVGTHTLTQGLARGKVDTNQTEYVVTRWYRAPELLCDNSHYDAKIDVWSTALVYAELLLGKTLLPGRGFQTQLAPASPAVAARRARLRSLSRKSTAGARFKRQAQTAEKAPGCRTGTCSNG